MPIQLKSSDNEIFTVDIAVCRMLGTLGAMLEDLGIEEGDSEPVSIPNVRGAILKKVLTWAEHYKDSPVANGEDGGGNFGRIPPWDAEFLKVEKNVLFEIILAANYLDMKGLANVAARAVANIIRDKSPGEIRQIFGIVNDLTPEEEEEIKRENAWCPEKY